jgi:hypothetical protein
MEGEIMPEIIVKEVYVYRGKQFRSLDEIYYEVENEIGRIIDAMDVTFTPNQKLKIFAGLVQNRKRLIDLMSVEIDISENPMYGDYGNILDMFAKPNSSKEARK